ncbi:MAG: lysophospholipid acyltransferase family protein [candidate division Zixibacteria bacterium]
MGLRAIGEENIPMSGSLIFASNHQSYLDPPFVSVMIRREIHFFAKKELFDIPILGWIITRLNTIPVRRGVYDPTSLNRVYDSLNKGGAILMFPEGTRGNGREFLKPKPGIGMIARKAEVPILPLYAWRTNKMRDALIRRKGMIIEFGQPISVDKIKEYPDNKEGYRELARMVMTRIGDIRDRGSRN